MFVEYAKESPEDILVQITVHNRGPEAGGDSCAADALVSQSLVLGPGQPATVASGGRRQVDPSCARPKPTWASAISIAMARRRCCSRKTKPTAQRLFSGQNRTPFVKDGINNFIVHGQTDAVNPQKTGTKAAAHYRLTVPRRKVRDGSAAA